jgi:hypothetical protein
MTVIPEYDTLLTWVLFVSFGVSLSIVHPLLAAFDATHLAAVLWAVAAFPHEVFLSLMLS